MIRLAAGFVESSVAKVLIARLISLQLRVVFGEDINIQPAKKGLSPSVSSPPPVANAWQRVPFISS